MRDYRTDVINMHPYHSIREIHLEITPHCNLRCRYCFIGDVPRFDDSLRFMSENIALEAVAAVFQHSCFENILVTFHGGEPLLQSANWFDQVCSGLKELAGSHDNELVLSLQTNGTLLSEEQLDVFDRHQVRVGISLDGVLEVNNAVRGGFERTIISAEKLHDRKLLGGIISVLTTINHMGVRDFMEFLESRGIHRVSFNEYWVNGRGTYALQLARDELFAAWRGILDYMIDTSGKAVCDRLTLGRVHRFLNPPSASDFRTILNCVHPFCHAGINQMHVSVNGKVFPCGASSWSSARSWELGDFRDGVDEITWRDMLVQFHHKPQKYESVCRICSASAICSFGCPAFLETDTRGMNELCAATRCYNEYLSTLPRESLALVDAAGSRMQLNRSTGTLECQAQT